MAIQNDNTLVTKGDIKTLYSEKIAPYLGANLALKTNVSDFYTEDEKIIGVWINGKPLYQKVVLTSITGEWQGEKYLTASLNTYINGLDEIISVTLKSDKDFCPAGGTVNGSSIELKFLQSGTYDLAIIQYTKETDAKNSAITIPGCYDINFPNTWPENEEIYFGNGVYGYHATGTTTLTSKVRQDIPLASKCSNIIAQGGHIVTPSESWTCPVPYTCMNVTANAGVFDTTAAVYLLKSGTTYNANLFMESANAGIYTYNVWVTYTK